MEFVPPLTFSIGDEEIDTLPASHAALIKLMMLAKEAGFMSGAGGVPPAPHTKGMHE